MHSTTTLGAPLPGQIDPAAKDLLDQLKAYPTFSQMDIPTARAVVAKLALDCGGDPAPVKQITDRHVRTPHGEISIRAYQPEGVDMDRSPILYLHGGGFITGSPEVYDSVLRGIAASSKRVVIAPGYSLSPEARFPFALDQIEAAYDWISRGEGHEYQARNQGVIVAGDSAGGNLAAALSRRLALSGRSPAAQILIYPATNFFDLDTETIGQFGEGYFITPADLRYFMAQYLPEGVGADHPDVSPQRDITPGLPPTLLITAEFDPLRSDGEGYGRKLQAAGVPVTYHCMHGQIHAFHLLPALFPAAREVNQIIQYFVGTIGTQQD